MVQKIKDLFNDHPKTSMFVVGVLCALLLVLIIWIVVKVSEHQATIARASPEGRFLLGSEHQSGIATDIALMLNEEPSSKLGDPRFSGNEYLEDKDKEEKKDINVGTPAPAAQPAKSNLTKGKSAEEQAEADSDTKATSHMLTRGGVERASVDSSRNRYLGLSSIGGAEYEGYVYNGNPLSDEQGELAATMYGVSESPWN